MRKFLVHPDGTRSELTPLTHEEFLVLNLWPYSSDMDWDAWLRCNDLHEADSFTEETLYNAVLVLEPGDKELKFMILDEDTYKPYEEARYISVKKQKSPAAYEWDKVRDQQCIDIKELGIEGYNQKYTKRFTV